MSVIRLVVGVAILVIWGKIFCKNFFSILKDNTMSFSEKIKALGTLIGISVSILGAIIVVVSKVFNGFEK